MDSQIVQSQDAILKSLRYFIPKMKILYSLNNIYRNATSLFRCLPDFLIIGAQKSGSTSLYDYLVQHPEISKARTKEVHYFSNQYSRGEHWYRSNFSYQSLANTTCEATPYYLYHPLASKRIFDLIPKVKIIAVLREPTSRALSHFQHAIKHKFENRSLMDALSKDIETYPELTAKVSRGELVFEHQEKSYVTRGYYKEQLDRYYELFSKEQILLLDSRELFKETEKTLKKVFEFLEVQTSFVPLDLSVKNKGDKQLIDEVDRNMASDWLQEHYMSFNQELTQAYNINFNDC